MKKLKHQNGITLVALVITIIVLLILAGISIQALTNQGLFEKTKLAKTESKYASAQEKVTLAVYASYDTTGKIKKDELKENLNKIEGIKGKIETIEYDLKIVVDGFEFTISEDGKISGNKNITEERKTVKYYIVNPAGTTDETIFCNEIKASNWWDRVYSGGIKINYAANQYKLYNESGSTNSNDVKITTVPLNGAKYKSITVKCLYYYNGGDYPNGCIYLTNSTEGTKNGSNWYMPTASEVIQKYQYGSNQKTEAYYRGLTGNSFWKYTDAIKDLSDSAWETHTFDVSNYDGDIYLSVFNNNGYFYVSSIEVEQYVDTIEK